LVRADLRELRPRERWLFYGEWTYGRSYETALPGGRLPAGRGGRPLARSGTLDGWSTSRLRERGEKGRRVQPVKQIGVEIAP